MKRPRKWLFQQLATCFLHVQNTVICRLTKVLEDGSQALMTQVFASNSNILKIEMLNVFSSFLIAQSNINMEKQAAESDAKIDMNLLVGVSQDILDSSLGSAIVQVYLVNMLGKR